ALCPDDSCCGDGDPCTQDVCECADPPQCTVYTCTHPPVCDDGDPCTANVCTLGDCDEVTCDYPPLCPPSGDACVDECCVEGVCHADPKPQPCSITLLGGGEAVCPDSTVTLSAEICNLGDECQGPYEFYGEQTDGPATIESVGFVPESITVQPGLCEPVEIHINIAAGSDPGLAEVRVTATSPEENCLPLNQTTCFLTATVTVVELDLDVDTDRSGIIGPEDDPDEHEWSWGPDGSGAVFLPNVDDDDWAAGHTVALHMDGTTTGIDGATDQPDLARVIVRQADIPSGWYVWLVMAANDDVTVYDLESGSAVLGLHAGGETLYEIPRDRMIAGDLAFGIESEELVRSGWPTTAALRLELRNQQLEVVCTDAIDLRLSSWLMTSNLDQAQTVYVRQLPLTDALYAASVQFVNDLQAALAGTGATLVVVDDPYYGGDVWMQDQVEFGFASGSYGSLFPIVFNSPRDRAEFGANHGLRDFAERQLFRPDMGYFTTGSAAGTQDAFGNLEVTPPVTVNGQEYPFGRIYTGLGMQLDIRLNFLSPQIVQDPFTLYTGWLSVEHVDEVVTFVPDLAGGGSAFKVLIADPTLGANILQAELDPGNTTIGKPGEITLTVEQLLERYGPANLGAYTTEMAAIKTTLMQELGLDASAFLDIPAFFEFPNPPPAPNPQYSEASSLLPNLLNLVVVNGRLVVAEPFYDAFKNEFLSRLSTIGYQEGASVRFIDDWDVYHDSHGDIHCGTCVERTPSRVDWWSHDVD
ncbi:MAG: hypothetical protein JSU86_04670, partial [Phycisphaerales bacterium]